MTTSWADAARTADGKRAERQQKLDAAAAAVASVAPMVEQFRQALNSNPDILRDLRYIATGEWSPGDLPSQGKKNPKVTVENPFEPERWRAFTFSLDRPEWSVKDVADVKGEQVTIGRGTREILSDRRFDEIVAAAEKVPEWLPVLLVDILRQRDVPVPTD